MVFVVYTYPNIFLSFFLFDLHFCLFWILIQCIDHIVITWLWHRMVSLFPEAPLCSPFVMKNSPIPELGSAWSTAQLGLTFCHPKDGSPPGSSVHGDSPGKNTGVGCHALLQGIFSTQGLNPDFLHCRQILYWLSHQGSIHSMNAGVSSPSLLQGIFLTQEFNPGLLQCRQILFFFFLIYLFFIEG